MASAVSEAGGLGILTALTQPSPEALRKEIRRTRTMTKKPFGVNLTILKMLIPADYDAYARVIAEEKVTMVEVAGGSPKKYIKMWHDAGVLVLHKSATMRHALKAQAAEWISSRSLDMEHPLLEVNQVMRSGRFQYFSFSSVH